MDLKEDSHRFIEELELKYKQETSINRLKIRKTNPGGYFVEVPAPLEIPPEFLFNHSIKRLKRYKTNVLYILFFFSKKIWINLKLLLGFNCTRNKIDEC